MASAKGNSINYIVYSMKFITWNVRGLNKVYKQKELKSFIIENKVSIIAILENRVNETKQVV